ncbi:MAG: ActS/PrrB/RegB family redox-sensitive histidine kinase [Parvibaculales bacterium]
MSNDADTPLGDMTQDTREVAYLTRDGGVLLRVQIFLRWLAVIGQLAAIVVVAALLGYKLPLVESLTVISLSVILNIWLILRYPSNHMLSVRETAMFLGFDLVQLVMLLYLNGGLGNPFALLILAPVTVSATILTAGTTWILVSLAAAASSLLAVYHLPLPWKGEAPPVLPDLYIFGIWMSLLLGLVFISTYVWRVSHEGRRMTAATSALQQVLAREHRLSALDGFAAAAAHQLGTPLGTIGLIAKELQSSPLAQGEHAEDLLTLQNEARRCREILTSLTADGDKSDQIFSQMNLTALIDSVIEEAGSPDVEVRKTFQYSDGREPVVYRKAEIIYGIGNLIENASDFAETAVDIDVTQSATEITITISDDGPGFAPDLMSRLGEPWLTTRANKGSLTAQSGMGLGFFIAKTMLERTGAKIEISNKKHPLSGAVINLTWKREMFEINGQ